MENGLLFVRMFEILKALTIIFNVFCYVIRILLP